MKRDITQFAGIYLRPGRKFSNAQDIKGYLERGKVEVEQIFQSGSMFWVQTKSGHRVHANGYVSLSNYN